MRADCLGDVSGEAESGGEEFAEGIANGQGGPQTSGDQQQVDHQNCGETDQAEFFTDTGHDEIGVGHRDQFGSALRDPSLRAKLDHALDKAGL